MPDNDKKRDPEFGSGGRMPSYGPQSDLDTQADLRSKYATDAQELVTAVQIQRFIDEEIEEIIIRRIQFENTLKQIAQMQAQYQALQAELKDMQAKIDDSEQLLRELNEQELQTLQDLMAERDHLIEEIHGLEGEISALQDTLNELTTQYDEIVEEIENISEEFNEVTQKVEELENQAFLDTCDDLRQVFLQQAQSPDEQERAKAQRNLKRLDKLTPEACEKLFASTPGKATLQQTKFNAALGRAPHDLSDEQLKELETTRLKRLPEKAMQIATLDENDVLDDTVSDQDLMAESDELHQLIMMGYYNKAGDIEALTTARNKQSELASRGNQLVSNQIDLQSQIQATKASLEAKTTQLSTAKDNLSQKAKLLDNQMQKVQESRARNSASPKSKSTQQEMRDKLRQVRSPTEDAKPDQQQNNSMKPH